MSALSQIIIESIGILQKHAEQGEVNRTLHELELVHLAVEKAAREVRALPDEQLQTGQHTTAGTDGVEVSPDAIRDG